MPRDQSRAMKPKTPREGDTEQEAESLHKNELAPRVLAEHSREIWNREERQDKAGEKEA